METYALDFETYYDKECSIKTLGPLGYFAHPKFDAYMVSVVGDNGYQFVGHPKDFDWSLLEGNRVLSHNASFDHTLYLYGITQNWWPSVNYGSWVCTADMAAACGLPRSLKNATAQAFNLEISKSTRDNMSGKSWESMSDEFKKEVSEYALKDSELCLRLWQEYNSKWLPFEQEVSRMNRMIMQRGLPIDTELLAKNLEIIRTELFNTEQAIPWAGEKPLLSRKAFDEECIRLGIEPPESLAQTNKESEDWIRRYGFKYQWINAVVNWRRINSLKAKLESFDSATMPDGRFYGNIMYFGGHCVSGDHEVLTKEGWVRIDEWGGGRIACYDPHHGSISFQESSANQFKRQQQMYEIDAPYVKGCFTAGHTMPRIHSKTLEPIPAKCGELAFMSQLKFPTGGVYHNNSGTLGPDEMRLLVAVQADGHWPSPHSSGHCIQFCLRKIRKIERITKLLEKLNITYYHQRFTSYPTQHRITIKKNDIPEWLTKDRKSFGPWVLEATREGLLAAVDELHHWDGHASEHDKEYYTTDGKSYEWAQIMIHLTGGTAMNRIPRKQKEHHKTCYRLGFRRKGVAQVYRKHWHTPSDMPSVVYCPTTPTGFWVYRYKGAIGVTGNTGRFSGSGGNLNLQNMPRDEMFGVNVRHMIAAPKGRKLVVADLSNIEVRTLCWAAEDHETLKEIANTEDIYEAFAIRFGLWDKAKGPLKQEPKLRHKVKALVLGCGYGAGAAKFAQLYDMPFEEAEEAVGIYRKRLSKIPKYWSKLTTDIQAHYDMNVPFEIPLPSGRSLSYGMIRMMKSQNADGKKSMQHIAIMNRNGKRQPMKLWGGICAENCSQAIARDILCYMMLEMEKLGINIIFHVHDEIVVECDENEAEEVLSKMMKIMSTPPDWCPDIPLAAEGYISQHYKK